MSSTPIKVDINDLLASFAAENAKQTQRAIIAEANVEARDRVIDELAQRVAELQQTLEAREALDEANPDDDPDSDDENLLEHGRMPEPDSDVFAHGEAGKREVEA